MALLSVERFTTLANVHYIDTGGWYPEEGGYFTLLDLNTLTPHFPQP